MSETHAKGGAATSRANRVARALPRTLRPISEGLERAFAAVEAGALDSRRATAMATLANALIHVYQASEYEARIRELEQQAADETAQRGGRWKGIRPWAQVTDD